MIVSIETPVAKGEYLRACVDSVLAQSDDRWRLSLWWDGGDASSRGILESIRTLEHPSIDVRFGERLGIAGARRRLTESSRGEYILPLDDDDCLAPDAVAEFLDAAQRAPWAGIVRARREFIDEHGRPVAEREWFPFAPRRYDHGITLDPYNHAQPTLIQRRAYALTQGWQGFAEYGGAGEDCDLVSRIEEVADVVLLDRSLYRYRLHGGRASHALGRAAAEDMWQRIADASLQRRGLDAERTNTKQPYRYRLGPRVQLEPSAVTRVQVSSGTEAARAVASRDHAVCLLDAAVSAPQGPIVDALVDAMRDSGADLAALVVAEAPPTAQDDLLNGCVALLARGEIWRCMPGPDAGCASAGAALADVAVRARLRGFDCRLLHWRDAGAAPERVPRADRERLPRRWRSLQAPLRSAAAHATKRPA